VVVVVALLVSSCSYAPENRDLFPGGWSSFVAEEEDEGERGRVVVRESEPDSSGGRPWDVHVVVVVVGLVQLRSLLSFSFVDPPDCCETVYVSPRNSARANLALLLT
jgi:hypothetical protein